MNLRMIGRVLVAAVVDWQRDRATRVGAAIAYYAIFSIPPILLISISIAGRFFGERAAKGQVFEQVQRFLGSDVAARAIEDLVRNAARPHAGRYATALGLFALWFGASGVFTELKEALNAIWEVERRPGYAVVGFVLQYVSSVLMVVAVGIFLLGSLAISSIISGASETAQQNNPWIPEWPWRSLDWCISIVVLTVLFAGIFKLIPNVVVGWRDVWVGAMVTAVLFTAGKFLIGVYLARLAIASAYGAAGSLILVLLWTYYSAQIVLFGAEVTQSYAR
ncbi:MAG TPA: YihY/virulence factor BrkB family protein, partial [Pirellulales bacterium]